MVYYILLVPLLLILYVLLKKKPTNTGLVKTAIDKKETYKIELSHIEKSDDNTNPYRVFFNGIVSFEEKIKGVNEKPKQNAINFEDYKALIKAANKKLNNNDKEKKGTYTDNIHSVINSLTSVEDFIAPPKPKNVFPDHFYRVAVYTKPGHYPTNDVRDFVFGDLATMRTDALAYYYERINSNINRGRNPVLDYYNHFPFSKYFHQDGRTIAIVIYLVKNEGDERFTEYLIGGDDYEFVADGRTYEASLFEQHK